MSELVLKGIEFIPAQIKFNQKEELIENAKSVAEYLNSMNITEENLAESKKKIAEARKLVNELNSKRIEISKIIKEPVDNFKKDVDEISKIISDAELNQRSKINEFEEKRKQEKANQIEEFWGLKKDNLCMKYFQFSDFLKKEHLNKSKSLKSIKEEMAEWIELKNKEIESIQNMEYASEILNEYIDCKDLSKSILIVQNRKKDEEKLKKKMEEVEVAPPVKKVEKIEKVQEEKEYYLKFDNAQEFELAKKYIAEANPILKFVEVIK